MKTVIAALVAVSALSGATVASAGVASFPGYIVNSADLNNDGVLTGAELRKAERRARFAEDK